MRNPRYTLIGAFVLVLGAAFAWGVLWISAGGAPRSFDNYLVYMTESVSGLNVDSALKYRGVDVGKVERIGIDRDNPQRIRILLQVREDIPITEDTVATLEYQGLTGLANINLSGGTADSKPLQRQDGEDYPVIQARPSLFARLDATTSDLLANLIQTSSSINALLDENNRANVARSLENVASLTDNLAEQSEALSTMIARLNDTLDNVSTASVDLPEMTRQFTASAESLARMADEVRRAGEGVSEATSGLGDTVEQAGGDLTRFSSATLPELSATVDELRLASENLRRLSEALARDPSILIYGNRSQQAGPGEDDE